MAIRIRCDNASCGKTLTVKEESAGRRVKCPGCGTLLEVPAAESAQAPDQQRKRRPKRKGSGKSGGSWLPQVVILGMPLPFFLVVAVVGLGVFGFVGAGVVKMREKAKAAAKKRDADWHEDYDAFLEQIKKGERQRIRETGGTGSPQLFFPVKEGRGLNMVINDRPVRNLTASADVPVQWEGGFKGVGKGTELLFDLETEWVSRVDNPSDKVGGAEFKIAFTGDPEKWKAVEQGKTVRFSGKISQVVLDTDMSRVGIHHTVKIVLSDLEPVP